MSVSETIISFLPWIAAGVVTVVGWFGVWPKVKTWADEKTKELAEKTKIGFLKNIDELLIGAGGHAYDELISNEAGTAWLQKATKDGKVEPKEWTDLKNRTVNLGKGLVDLEILKGMIGGGDPIEYLKTRAGPALAASKARGKDAKKINPSTPAR